jgi:hypothetical protein
MDILGLLKNAKTFAPALETVADKAVLILEKVEKIQRRHILATIASDLYAEVKGTQPELCVKRAAQLLTALDEAEKADVKS